MKPLIVLSLVALAHARCDYPSGIGLWHPEPGQNSAVVMWDLGITEQELKALNPTTNINLIYPEMSYNVTVGPSRSGTWTDGCPPSLRIKDTPDTAIVVSTDEAHGTPESTSVADADGYHDQLTRTMYETVETGTRSSTVFADSSHPSSPSIPEETQSAGTPDQPFKEGKGTESRSEVHTAAESISEVPGSAMSKSTATRSEDEEGSLINTSKTQHSDVSATSAAGKSEDVHEVPSATSGDVQEETAPSYTTMDDEVTRTSTQSDASSTSSGAKSTTVSEEGRKPESVADPSSIPSSVSGATKSETAPPSGSSTTTTIMHTQTDGSHSIKTGSPSGTSFQEECTDSSKHLSSQESSGGADASLASTSTTDTATSSITRPKEPTGSTTSSGGTTMTEGTSTQTKSATLDTASDETTPSLDTVLGKTTTGVTASTNTGSAGQTGGQTTTLSTETKTTLTTSASEKISGSTTTTSSYDEKETRLAMCFYDSVLPIIGQTDDEIVYSKVKEFCGISDIDRSMKAEDKCITSSTKDSSNISYEFQICPRGYCPNYGQNMRNPFGQNALSCVDIFFHTIWSFCNDRNHRGNGGWWNTTCLEYTLKIS